jgi:hypothetical protein
LRVLPKLFFYGDRPQELYLFGQPVYFSPIATYSIGFFGFWLVCRIKSDDAFLSENFR